MSKTLVTGATGRLGANVVAKLLERGEELRALVMPNDPLAKKLDGMGIEIFEDELTQAGRLREAVRGLRTVMHFGDHGSDPGGNEPRDLLRHRRHSGVGALRLRTTSSTTDAPLSDFTPFRPLLQRESA